MADGKEKDAMPIRVEVGARAEAKLAVTAEIPTASAGRFVDTITDIFRPFSEARGLRADQIRLQREDVLLEIAKRAKARLELEAATTKPVPLKFLVPFIEKASLEDVDSELVDAWANLLVAAAESFDPKLIVYPDILARLGSKDAIFLHAVCLRSNYKNGVSWPTGHFETNEKRIQANIPILDQSLNPKFAPDRTSTDELTPYWLEFKEKAKLEYGYIIHAVGLPKAGGLYFYNTDISYVDGLMVDRLEAERLVKRTIFSYAAKGNATTGSVSYLDLTYLAIDLVSICTRNFTVPFSNPRQP
jgi:hypothetical protein